MMRHRIPQRPRVAHKPEAKAREPIVPRSCFGLVGTWLVRACLGLSIVATAAAPACAGRDVTIKLIPVELDKAPFVVPLVAPGATCAAAGDVQSMVAVGQKVGKDAQVSLFKVDAQGKPAAAAVVVKLPRPATVAGRETYPLSLVFHPTLPLLYVWQDVEALKGDPVPPTDPAWKDLDHLLIYSLDAATPELLLALCRGPQFHTGNVAGSLCLDLPRGRLYVPNLRFGEKSPPEKGGGVGWFALAGDGLPISAAEEPAKPEPPVAPPKALADRPARLAALRGLVAASKPVGAFAHTPPEAYGFGAYPCGAGFIPISHDVFITCGYLGAMTWDLADRRARCQLFLMPVNFVTYYCARITPHPTLPVVYATMSGYSYAHRVEHVDGYFTLAPQVAMLDGATLKGLPVVLAKRSVVAWSITGAVYLAPIDAEGRFKNEKGTQVNVPNALPEALTYSEKLDRLYVAVEKLK